MDIFKAARSGDLKTLAACKAVGENLNSHDHLGMTALIWAVDMGHTDVVRWLVEAKVDLNLVDNYGQTALILAAGRNDCDSLRILIGAKADINIKMVTGVTALGKALENKKSEATALLKKAGAK
jgi:ankyrin repeat protein